MRILLGLLVCLISFQTRASSELIYEAHKKNIQLTEKDKAILEVGEISTTRYVLGGIIGTYPIGLGLGHTIQGRWSEQGYIFTWGELGSLSAVVIGAAGCVNNDKAWACSGLDQALIITGAIGYIGLRIWEIVDVWAVPPSQNSKFKDLKKYIENEKVQPQIKSSLDLVPIVAPRFGQGLGLKFVF